jgi:Protein of unknown function (DUF664)
MRRSDAEVAGERDVLGGFLDDARRAVLSTLTGVPVALLREPLIWPHGSLLAIVKHLTHLERWWFVQTFAGLDMTPASFAGRSPEEWRLERSDTAWGVIARYHGACQRSRLIADGAALDQIAACAATSGRRVALRWIVLHMIEETNRHAGHADVLRQLIDGTTGSPPCAREPRDGDAPRLPVPQPWA